MINVNKNKNNIEILGHRFSMESIHPMKSEVEAIKKIKLPQTPKELQSYLGLKNYCRKFIPKLSDIVKPLYDQLNHDISIQDFGKKICDAECKETFNDTSQTISKDTLITIPDKRLPFIITTDASNVGISALFFTNPKW